jgi:hypothetical protein
MSGDGPLMIYRARLLRWGLALTGVFAGWSLTFAGSEWRSTPSLTYAASSHIPLWCWGIGLFVYAFLLITDIGDLGRIIGYALGAAICAFFTVSYGWTVFTQGLSPKNGVILAFLLDAVIFHAASIRVTVERQIGRT